MQERAEKNGNDNFLFMRTRRKTSACQPAHDAKGRREGGSEVGKRKKRKKTYNGPLLEKNCLHASSCPYEMQRNLAKERHKTKP